MLVAARPGLGTINHTLLTLEAARAAGLDVRAVVLTPWPARAGRRSSARTARRSSALGGVEVATLATRRPTSPAALAAAGDALPYERWLALSRPASSARRRRGGAPRRRRAARRAAGRQRAAHGAPAARRGRAGAERAADDQQRERAGGDRAQRRAAVVDALEARARRR